MRAYTTVYLAAMTIFLTGCCCFEPAITDEDSPIIVREATLPEFNSRFNGNNPDPSFNISMFRFPSSYLSSGDLPNDNRFRNGPWTSSTTDYPLRGLSTFYLYSSPPNSLIDGDFMVVRVNPTLQEAVMRVKGSMFRLPGNPLLTDNASTFANEIRKYVATQTPPTGTSVCQLLASQAVQYGVATPTSTRSYDTMFVKTNAGADTNVVYPGNWPRDSSGVLLPPVKGLSDISIYDINVRPGDWFYYKAANGMSFFVVVTNIQAGILTPNINRVTFKFAEAYQCLDCKK